MSTPHPDQEALAELAGSADAADAAETADVRSHIADCAQCTADLAALGDLRATLRALPPIPMPPDVAARLEAAVAAEAASAPTPAVGGTADVVPFARPARSRPPRTREFPLGAAAAVVLVLAVGAVAIGLSNKGESKSSPRVAAAASSSAAASTASTTVIESGTNYTAADIRAQVIGVVNSAAPDAANQYGALAQAAGGSSPAAPAAAAATSAAAAAPSAPAATESAAPLPGPVAADGSAPAFALPARTAPSGPLADPAALARCIQTLVQKAEQPVLVDYATFNGVPSTIIVLPDPDVAGKLDVYVEADTANCASDVTFVTYLPPPASPAH